MFTIKSDEHKMQPDEKHSYSNTNLSVALGLQATNVNVAIRIRPPLKENSSNSSFVVSPNKRDILDTSRGVTYTLDAIFDKTNSTKDVFDSVVKPIVDSCVEGFNGTVLAYGQTSSGKTHTMQGNPTMKEDGIISYSLRDIFDQIDSTTLLDYSITLTYVEVYNETLIDLIGPTLQGNNVKGYQDEEGGIMSVQGKMSTSFCKPKRLPQVTIVEGNEGFVELKGATVYKAVSFDETVSFLECCDKSRHVSDTHLNERSSRSHTILTVRIESKTKSMAQFKSKHDTDKDGCRVSLRVGLLNLVDLAGSEGVSRSKTEGLKRFEGSKINRSLLALTRVISQIVKRQQRSEKEDIAPSHITYRDSKLTRLLSNSLGGNSKTLIICCCSPELCDARESISTLEFASRAKCIRNKAKVNLIETLNTSTGRIHEENLRLREEVLQLRAGLATEKVKTRSNLSSNHLSLDVGSPYASCDFLSRRKRLPPSSPDSFLGSSDKKKAFSGLKTSQIPFRFVGSVCSPKETYEDDLSFQNTPPIHDFQRTACVSLMEISNRCYSSSTYYNTKTCLTRCSVLCLATIFYSKQSHSKGVNTTEETKNCNKVENRYTKKCQAKIWSVIRNGDITLNKVQEDFIWCKACHIFEGKDTICKGKILKQEHEKELQMLALTLEQKYATEICTLREQLVQMKQQNHVQLLKQKKEYESTFQAWQTKKLEDVEREYELKTTVLLNKIQKDQQNKIKKIQNDLVVQEKVLRETLEKEFLLRLCEEQETLKKTLQTLHEENIMKVKQEWEGKFKELQSSYDINVQEMERSHRIKLEERENYQNLKLEEKMKIFKDNLSGKLREAQEKTDMFEKSAYTLQKQLEENQKEYEIKQLKSRKLIESLQAALSQNGFLLEENFFLQKKIDTLTQETAKMSSHLQEVKSEGDMRVKELQKYCENLEKEKVSCENRIEETLRENYDEKIKELNKCVILNTQTVKSLEQNIAQKEQQVNDLLQKLQESQQQVRRSEKQRTDQVKNYFALQEQVEQLQKENSTLQENFTTCQHSLQYLKQVEKQNRDYFTQSLQQKCACIDRCLTESTQILVNQHTFEHSLLSGWEESLQDTLSVTSFLCVFSLDIFSSYLSLFEIYVNDLDAQAEELCNLHDFIRSTDMMYAERPLNTPIENYLCDSDVTHLQWEICLNFANLVEYQKNLFHLSFELTYTITDCWKGTLQNSEQQLKQYSQDLQQETTQLFAVRQEYDLYRKQEQQRKKQQEDNIEKLVEKLQRITHKTNLHASTDTSDLPTLLVTLPQSMCETKNVLEETSHTMHNEQNLMLEEMKLFYEERLNATESLVTTYKRNVQELTRELDALYKDHNTLRNDHSRHCNEMYESKEKIQKLQNEILYWKSQVETLQAQTANESNDKCTLHQQSQPTNRIRSVLKSTRSTSHLKCGSIQKKCKHSLAHIFDDALTQKNEHLEKNILKATSD